MTPSSSSGPRQRLLARIAELGGQVAYPVVPLDLFFDGNDDDGSFAPNLEPHPGIDNIYATLRKISERDEVSDVLIQIDEVDLGPYWPYASSAYVITTATAEDVHLWARSIQPNCRRPSPTITGG